jgi:hypothetical protein
MKNEDAVKVARKIRALALGIDGTSTEKALLLVAQELERLCGTPSPEPLKVKWQRLYQFSANRMAFATVNVKAHDYDEALGKAHIEAMGLSDAAWSSSLGEIEIEGQVVNGVVVNHEDRERA